MKTVIMPIIEEIVVLVGKKVAEVVVEVVAEKFSKQVHMSVIDTMKGDR